MNWKRGVTFKKFIEQIDSDQRLNPTKNAMSIARANIEIALRTKKGNVLTMVTAIEFFEDDLPLICYCASGIEPKNVTGATLSGAAKDVYDFCNKQGLKPNVTWRHSGDQNHLLRITVQLPVGKKVKKVKFPKEPVTPRKKAKLGSQ